MSNTISNSVITMKLNQASQFDVALITALETKIATIFWGSPGIGKTARIGKLVEDAGYAFFPLVASTRMPTDFIGMPILDKEYKLYDLQGELLIEGKAKYSPPDWALDAYEAIKAGKKVVVFIDELNTCPPAVQSALLRPINEGFIDKLDLRQVVWLAAGNPRETSSGFTMSSALMNRFMHCTYEPSLESWINWVYDNEEKIVYEQFDQICYKEMFKHYVSQFVQTKRIQLDRSVRQGESMTFTTRRSFTNAVAIASFLYVNGIEQKYISQLLSGCVAPSDGQMMASDIYKQFKFFKSVNDITDDDIRTMSLDKFIGILNIIESTKTDPQKISDGLLFLKRSMKERPNFSTVATPVIEKVAGILADDPQLAAVVKQVRMNEDKKLQAINNANEAISNVDFGDIEFDTSASDEFLFAQNKPVKTIKNAEFEKI